MKRANEKTNERRTFLRWMAASPLCAVPAATTAADRYLVGELTAKDVANLLGDAVIASADDALNVYDFERVASGNLPPAHFGYLDSSAGDGSTRKANRESIAEVRLRLRRLQGITQPDTSVQLFGEDFAAPVFLCPIASLGSMHPQGELAVAAGAREQNIPMAMSTFSSNAIEPVNAARGQPVWFQLYTMSTWLGTERLIRRAEKSGASVLLITIDTPMRVTREDSELYARADDRDCTACHELPISGPQKKPMAAGLDKLGPRELSAASLTWESIQRIRGLTDMKIVLKGIETREDAEQARRLGIDAIYVSNHGGRGIHASRGTLECLPEVVAGAGDLPVLVDSGFRRGTDVFKALALGATAVGIGRPYVWGLGAFGQEGVEKVIDLVVSELKIAMAQAGAATLGDIREDMVVTHEDESKTMPAADKGFFHVGIWLAPADLDRALVFYRELLDFRPVSRAPRKSGGERLFLRNGRGELIELLIDDKVTQLDDFPQHPKDRVAGIAHLCFEVPDLLAARATAERLGAEIIQQAPNDGSFGGSEAGTHRILFIEAPGGTTIELFEFLQKSELVRR